MASSARGTYRNGARTRRRIIDSAMTAFAERGFYGVSIRQIAQAVGISPAALVRHFGSKDELFVAVIETWAQETAVAQGAAEGKLPGLAYWEAQEPVMHYHVAHRGLLQLFIVMVTESTDPNHPAHKHIRERYQQVIGEFITALVQAQAAGEIGPLEPGQAEAEARALIAMMDGLEIQWLLDPAFDLVAQFDRHLRLTWERLGARAPATQPTAPGSRA